MKDEGKDREGLLREVRMLRERIEHLERVGELHEGMEKALLESEELYRAVVETIADGIAITVNTERVFVNRAFLTIHGLKDPSEIVGHPLEGPVFPGDREAVKSRVLARQRGEPVDEIVEYRIERPNGEVRTVQASVVATTYKGQPATMAVLRDITALKQAEMEIVRLNEELGKRVLDLRNANEELEAFNSTVSHDLRTPLMVIRGFSGRILKKYSDRLDEKFVADLKIIEEGALKMEQLINDLLAFSRVGKQALQRRVLHVNDLISSILKELRSIYPGGEITVAPLALSVGDERLVRQVFTNLLSNALKFSSRKATRMIEVGCISQEGENIYFVKDNGAGFDMTQRDRLFNVFQRLHPEEEFEGTGMGLAIVKKIINLHGGRVWAEGKPGEGAVFYVTLPPAGSGTSPSGSESR